MRSRTTKLAAAAVLALALLLLARHLVGRETPAAPIEPPIIAHAPKSEVVPAPATAGQEQEQIAARELFAKGDTKGLVQLLDTGLSQTKIVAAGYLAQIGDESVLPALGKLAAQWTGPAQENPFQKSMEQIQSRTSHPEKTRAGTQSREQMPTQPPADAGRSLTITVRVSEKATGAPIPHATIGTFASGKGERHTSDANGVFVFDLGESVPALVMISVSEEGYVGRIVSLRDLSREKLPQTMVFSLEKGTVIGGVVQDAAGRPIKGARVESVIQEQQKFDQPRVHVSMKETTDDQGRWRSLCMPAQIDRLWFNVYHPQFADGGFEMPKDLRLDDLRAERAVMVLQEGIVVAGRVMDAAGNPIAGAELLAGQSYNGRDWTKTDVAGHFEFPHLRATSQSFLLTVQAKGFAPQRQELPSQKNLAPVQFVLQPAMLLIGRVVDNAGHPVEDAYVSAQRWNVYPTVRWSSRTDAQGLFAWDYAPRDAIEIHIGKEGYREIWPEVVADGQEHAFILTRPMTIRGSVTDSQTGKPVSRFRLIPGLEGARGGLAKWQPSDDWARWFAAGRYSYTFSADAQAYRVRIEAEGYAPAESRVVDANEVDATIDVALTRSAGPSGYVFDAEARPVAGVQIFWVRYASIQNGYVPNADSLAHTTTGSDGHFAFPADNREDPLLALGDQGVGIVSWEEFAKTGSIPLTAWARVQGDLRLGRQPAAGRTLQLTCYNRLIPSNIPTRSTTITDANGRFAFERVYPGDFTLYNRAYQVLPGQTLELHLGGTGRTVRGQLVLPGLEDTPLTTTLAVGPRIDMSFDRFPKPRGYEQMSRAELRAWLDRWIQSQEGKAYQAWLIQTYPRITQRSLPVEMDGHFTFHVDNVESGSYVLRGLIRYPLTHANSRNNELLGRLWRRFEVPPLTRESDLDVPLDLGAVTVLPGALKPGAPAPDFDVPTLGPNRLRLPDYRGKVLLVSFYNSGDVGNPAPGLDDLKAVYRRFRADPRYAQIGLLYSGLYYLTLNRLALEQAGLDWPHGLVAYDGKESMEYSLPGPAPRSVLISPQGEVLAVGLSGAALTQAVEQALGVSPR